MTTQPQGDSPTVCVWTEDEDGNWHTDCGEMHCFTEGSPTDNSYRFCCYCGLKLGTLNFDPARES